MTLPAHVTETVEVTRTYLCGHCRARLILGTYEADGHAEELLADWLNRHAHTPVKDGPR